MTTLFEICDMDIDTFPEGERPNEEWSPLTEGKFFLFTCHTTSFGDHKSGGKISDKDPMNFRSLVAFLRTYRPVSVDIELCPFIVDDAPITANSLLFEAEYSEDDDNRVISITFITPERIEIGHPNHDYTPVEHKTFDHDLKTSAFKSEGEVIPIPSVVQDLPLGDKWWDTLAVKSAAKV
jgi:hypothetical protein